MLLQKMGVTVRIKRNLEQIWEQLRGQMPTRKDAVTRLQIKNFRGIRDLQVSFSFPVTVLAGANGCGKSTVLYALGCAYNNKAFLPQKLFPDFRPLQLPDIADVLQFVELHYSYNVMGQSFDMCWARRPSGWTRSFFGRKGVVQPDRAVYLHTLSKFSNPSEMRSVRQLSVREYNITSIDASDIAMANRILGYNFVKIALAHRAGKDILVAERVGEIACRYSEYHMSAGERAVVWLSLHLSRMRDALVLIDEIDTGLHPYTQRLLMLELQRLALRNNLQIVCTTHSAVVQETVPPDARIFLERSTDNVMIKEAWRDIIQKSLYGYSQDGLTFLCEDVESEGFIRGIFDYLCPKLDLLQNDLLVGRDSGKEQFLAHFETLRQFKKLNDVVFILDGDAQKVKEDLESKADKHKMPKQVFCLPGGVMPEQWAWDIVLTNPARYTDKFGYTEAVLKDTMLKIDAVFANASDKPTNIMKHKLQMLLDEAALTNMEFFRTLGFLETRAGNSDVLALATDLENIVRNWRLR